MKKRNQLLARFLIAIVAMALIIYVALDTLYFHVFFSADNADVSTLVTTTIVLAALFLFMLVPRKDKTS